MGKLRKPSQKLAFSSPLAARMSTACRIGEDVKMTTGLLKMRRTGRPDNRLHRRCLLQNATATPAIATTAGRSRFETTLDFVPLMRRSTAPLFSLSTVI